MNRKMLLVAIILTVIIGFSTRQFIEYNTRGDECKIWDEFCKDWVDAERKVMEDYRRTLK